MRKAILLFLIFSTMLLSGNMFAETKKRAEISLGGGIFFSDGDNMAFGAASLGYHTKIIGAELNGAIFSGGAVLGGNLLIGLLENKPFIPYATGGIWTTTDGGFGFDVGGGLKLKLSEVFAIRVEYRRYFFDDGEWGINTIIGGICLFF